MNPEDPDLGEDSLLTWLVACDKALAAEAPPPTPSSPNLGQKGVEDAETPTEWRSRLEGNVACIQMLRQVLARRTSSEPAALAAGVGLHPAADASGSPAADLPFRQLGRFQVKRLLGQGAFGMVFLAADPQLGRDVALKVPRPDALLVSEVRERFLREARAAASLDHPNLVPVYEAGAVGPFCYIASAYCPGITLSDWLKERSELAPLRVAAALVATLADAVGHAHVRGVIHRDLKPSNVLLQGKHRDAADADSTVQDLAAASADTESDLVPRITDFGLAKLTADAPAPPGETPGAETRSGAVLGTPNYMAPEQARGKNKEIGPAADTYALGAMLYELLTGQPPFRGETLLDILEQVRTVDPLPPGRLRPKLPRDLETICLKCLQKEPRKRYESAAALADDLRRYLAGEPIRARPIRVWERAIKWARRKPTQALLAAAAIVLAAVIVSYSAVLAESNTQLKDRNTQLEEIKAALEKSNTQLQKSNEELKRQRDEAREAAVYAEQSLDEIFTTSQKEWSRGNFFTMARIGAPSELRLNPQWRQFLQKGLDFCTKFSQTHGENPALRHEAGRAYSICGEIYYLLERYADSEQALEKALDLQAKLMEQFPDQLQYKLDRVWTYHDLYFTYMDQKAFKQAEATVKRMMTIQEQLVREHPTEFAYYRDLANSYYELGDCYRKAGREQECLDAHRHITRLWEKAAHDGRSKADFAVQLALSYDWIGSWMRMHGRAEEGLEWRTKGIGILEAALKKEPRNYDVKKTLRNTLSFRAENFEFLGRYSEARVDWERAIELDREVVLNSNTGAITAAPRDTYRMFCARLSARMGDHAKAAAEAQALTAPPWADQFLLIYGATVFALSSAAAQRDAKLPEAERSKLAERYAASAVDCLNKAKAAGYFGFESAARIESLRKDKDLDVLRKRKDFQGLMQSLQPKGTP